MPNVLPLFQKHCQDCHPPAPKLLRVGQLSRRRRPCSDDCRSGFGTAVAPLVRKQANTGEFTNRRGMSLKSGASCRFGAHGVHAGRFGQSAVATRVSGKQMEDRQRHARCHDQDRRAEVPSHGGIDYRYIPLPHVSPKTPGSRRADSAGQSPGAAPLQHGLRQARRTVNATELHHRPGARRRGDDSRPGVGFKIPAGSRAGLQMHYVTTGKQTKMQISVGLSYAKETVDKQLAARRWRTTALRDSAGRPAPQGGGERARCNATSIGVGLFSHMHVRGKDMTFTAPLSRRQGRNAARHSQLQLRLADPLPLGAGQRSSPRARSSSASPTTTTRRSTRTTPTRRRRFAKASRRTRK